MYLSELLSPRLISPELRARTRNDAVRELAALLAASQPDMDADDVVRVVLEREALASTGIGEGVAIPHGSLSGTKQLVGAMGRSAGGIDFQSVDGRPARLIFLLVVPRNQPGVHLKTLANITKVLKNDGFRGQLLSAADEEGIMTVLRDAEAALASP